MDGKKAEASMAERLRWTQVGPERIVFFIDLHNERPGQPNSELEVFKQCVNTIILTKGHMLSQAEYALCVLLEGAVLLSDFTLDTNELLKQVNSLEGTEAFQSLDMSSVFSTLLERKQTPLVKPPSQAPAAAPQGQIDPAAQKALLRGVFLYSRTNVVPSFGGDKSAFEALSTDADFVMDALFVHPPASKQGAESKAQAVFDFLIDLDRSSSHDRAYCFESTANPRRVLRNAVQLAPHARQRPPQGDLLNVLTSSPASSAQMGAVPGAGEGGGMGAIPVGRPIL